VARDLGIEGVGVGGKLEGSAIIHDFSLTLTDGSTVDVSLAGAGTLGDVMTEIYNAGGGALTAVINDAGNGLDIYDYAGGAGNLTVTALNGSSLASDLGIAGSGTGDRLNGGALAHDLRITLSDGTTVDVALGGADTIGDALDAINANSNLSAVINGAGNGIDVSDTAGGAGNLIISDLGDSTAATDLGIAGTGSGAQINGSVLVSPVTGTTFSNIIDAAGGAGADLLIGDNQDNTLIGGDGADRFQLSGSWGSDIIEDYGEGGIDVLDLSAVAAALTVTFHADGTVSVTDGTNTLDNADVIEGVIGGSGNNTFVFEDGADFAGFIDGGAGGANVLDYSAYTTAVTVDLAGGTATGTTGIDHIHTIVGGSGDDTLTGDDEINTIIGGDGADTITGGGGNDLLAGGVGDDTYIMTNDGTDTITELAGEGTDTLDYSDWGTALTMDFGAGTAPGTDGVSNIERVVGTNLGDTMAGTTGDDTFVFLNDWDTDTVTDPSAVDSDTLDFSAVTQSLTFTFTGTGAVSISDGTNTLSDISNVESLIGGSADDTFVFVDNWGNYTITSAGEIDNDTLDFSAVTADLAFTIHDDGTVSVTDGTNILGASGGIDNIIGGAGINTFVFEDQGYLNAYIDGGAGTAILDYSAYTTTVSVDLSQMDVTETRTVDGSSVETVLTGSASGVKGINNIDEVVGGGSTGDLLTGFEESNAWVVGGANSGTITGNDTSRAVTFTGFENLAGHADYDDTFSLLSTGSVSGSLIGQEYGPSSAIDTVRIEDGSYTDVVLAGACEDSGWIERDGDITRFIGMENVIDLSTADNKAVSNTGSRTARVYLAGDPYAVDQEWTLIVDGVDYVHTVANENEVLADVLTTWVGLLQAAGYTAIVRDNTIQVTGPTGVPAVSTTVPDGITALVESPVTSDAGIRVDMDSGTGRITIVSDSDSFVDFEMAEPTTALDLNTGAGDDSITVGASFAPSATVTIDGESGTDRITYEVRGVSGTAQTVTHGASSLSLNGSAVFDYVNTEYAEDIVIYGTSGADTIDIAAGGGGTTYVVSSDTFDDITFDNPGSGGQITLNSGDGDDSVAVSAGSFDSRITLQGGDGTDSLDLGSCTYNTLSVAADFETVTAVSADVTNFVFDARPAIANRVTVSRPGAGQIQIVDETDIGTTTTTINDPTGSLTINTGYNAPGTTEYIHVQSLGALDADLTLDAGSLNRNSDGSDSVVIQGDITLAGHTLEIKADAVTIESGVTVSTSNTGGTAGDIKIEGRDITLETNAALLSDGTIKGDISIEAADYTNLWTPFVNVDITSVSFTMKNGARIVGGDVEILSSAHASRTFDSNQDGFAGDALSLLDTALGTLESLASLEIKVSYVEAHATIDIQAGSAITAENFTAYASSYANVKAVPTMSWFFGGAAGVAITEADVTIAGNITVTGDVTIRSLADNTMNVVASPSAVKGIASAVAISVIDSESMVHVTKDAVLAIGGNLSMRAETVDRNRTTALSVAGKDGAVGIAVAITVEDGSTNAWLDGDAVVGGDVLVSAGMRQENVSIRKLFFLPSTTIGTTAQAGVGTNSKGDILDDAKTSAQSALIKKVMSPVQGRIDKIVAWFKKKLHISDESKEFPFDVAGAVAVVVDSNRSSARIGDGDDATFDGMVDAGGSVLVVSTVANCPYITAGASAENNPDTTPTDGSSDSKFSGAAAVSVGIYNNDADAVINSGAVVDAVDDINVYAGALNDYEFVWGRNLYDVWTQEADYTTEDTGVTVLEGETVEVSDSYTGNGDKGTWYKYIGAADLHVDDFATDVDFSDETLWEAVNPLRYKGMQFVTLLTTYMGGDFGMGGWLGNSWTQATAAGEKLAVAGAVSYIELNGDADAIIKSGAQINQNVSGAGVRDVVVQAVTLNEAVHLGGNIQLPGISSEPGEGKIQPKLSARYKPKDLLGSSAEDGKGAVGATVMINSYNNNTTARIEEGVALYADSLLVDAETGTMNVAVGASGGQGGKVAFNGVVIVDVLDNQTISRIDAGADIVVGSAPAIDVAFDPADTVSGNKIDLGDRHGLKTGDAVVYSNGGGTSIGGLTDGATYYVDVSGTVVRLRDSDGNLVDLDASVATGGNHRLTGKASLVVNALDDTILVDVAGGVAVSDAVGIGASVSVNIVSRDTQAVIGDLHDTADADQTAASDRGSVTVDGDAVVAATNDGFIGGFSVAGGVTKGSKQTADTGDGDKPNPGTGGTQGSDGSVTSNQALATWQDKWRSVLTEGRDQGKLSGDVAGDTSKSTSQTSQSKSGFGLSGSVVVDVIEDDARAYMFNTGDVAITNGGSLAVEADNSSDLGSFAGAVAFAKGSGQGSGTAVGGAFGVNVLSGATEAYIDGSSSLTADDLTITADRSGWNVAVVAGIGIGLGQKGVGVAGSVAVNISTYTTEAALRDITGAVQVTDLTVSGTDSTNLVAIAGSVAFGGKAGVGVAMSFSWTETEVSALVSGLDDFTYTGDVTVDAAANGLIVAVTGSVGISAGQAKGYAGAGTVSINLLQNTVSAEMVDVTPTAASAGNVSLDAGDNTSVYSFAGAIAAGKTGGLGAAIAVNSLNNSVTVLVDGTTVDTTGDFSATAHEAGTVVTLAVAGSGGEKLAIAGSVAINIFDNTIGVEIVDSAITAGAVALRSEDRSTSVALAGGIAIAAGSTGAAGGAAVGVNLIFNTAGTRVENSSITAASTIGVDAVAEELLASVTLGGAGGSKFALGGSFSANVVMNTVSAEIISGSTLETSGDIDITASDTTTAVVVAGGFAGAGKAAVGLALSEMYVGNEITAAIDDSTVMSTGGAVSLAAGIAPPATKADLSDVDLRTYGVNLPETNSSSIYNVTVGGAGSGKVAAGFGVSTNIVNNTIAAEVRNGAVLDGHAGVALSAIDASVIDAIAFGGAGSGSVAGGGAISANVITNDIHTGIFDSTVRAGVNADGTAVTNTDAAVTMDSQSSSIIRALGMGVSGSGKVAVSVSALGNAVANDVTAEISGSTVMAGGDVSLLASDIAPAIIPSMGLPPGEQATLDDSLSGSPVDPQGNILAIMVSVAGSGQTAVSGALMGNVITNTVETMVDDSTVLAGVNADTGGVLNAAADVSAAALSRAGIMAITVGVGGSGNVAVQATGFGNVIANTVASSIQGGAIVSSGHDLNLRAYDQSSIRSLAIGVAASGSTAVSALIGANVVTNSVTAQVAGSAVSSGAAMVVEAQNSSIIYSFAGGVAASGSTAVQVSLAANVITNHTEASINDRTFDENGDVVDGVTIASTVDTGGPLSITADDSSSIDAFGIGVSGSGSTAVGVALSANVITNSITSMIPFR